MKVLFVMGPDALSRNAWPRVLADVALGGGVTEIGSIGFGVGSDTKGTLPLHVDYMEHVGWEDLPGFSRSNRALAAYNTFVAEPKYQHFRFLSLKMLGRKDLTGTFRFLDREVYLQAALLQLFDVLQARNPDVLVFPVTPHEFLPFVAQNVAERLGIRILFFQPSPMAPTLLARTSLNSIFPAAASDLPSAGIGEHVEVTLRRSFARLVEGQNPIYMDSQLNRDRYVVKWWSRFKALRVTLRWLRTNRFPESVDLSGHNPNHGFFSRLLKVLLVRSLQRNLREKALLLGRDVDSSKPYAILALHYEPERTSMPEGLPIDFQGDALTKARGLLPDETTLVVKEHYSQQSAAKRGFAGRTPLFYDLVESMPNTVFAKTTSALSSIVGRAECVVTLTGTIALEAVLRGVPVGYFGTPWWEGLPGTTRITDGVKFEDLVGVALPGEDQVFAFLKDLHDNLMIPGIGSEPLAVVVDRLGPLPEGFFEAEAHAISAVIRSFQARV
jgi:hypothetical protein